MIEMSNYILLIIYGLMIPCGLGLLWTRKSTMENSIAWSLTSGMMTMMMIFEVMAVPFILYKQPFHTLLYSWKIVIWGLFALSLCINIRTIPTLFQGRIRHIFNKPKLEWLIWIFVIFFIAFQTYMPVGHMRVDTDDARFVAEAMEACELDTMLQYHPITGELLGHPIGEMQKDVASPFPIYMALMSSLFQLPPAVAVHIFFPLLFIPFAYVVYYLIGRYFTNDQKQNTALFLFFLALIHCFAYESIYAAGYTLLAVIWQGRSVLAMVVMPFIWLLLMRLTDQLRGQWKDYLLLLCSVTAGLMTSSMAIELLPILLGTYSLVSGVKNRSIKSAVLVFICIIPCAVCYLIYRQAA